MRRRFLGAITAVALALLAASPRGSLAATGYTWAGDAKPYADNSSGYWYYTYIEALRRVKMIDGHFDGWNYYIYPGSGASLSWYARALMEAYAPSLSDQRTIFSDAGYYADNRRWFLPYADAMVDLGLIADPGPPYGTAPFPEQAWLQRQVGFALLIRAIGAKSIADGMSEAEVQSWLGRFQDGWLVAPEYRHDMALGVKLGVIKGALNNGIYTLDPTGTLTRAQVAAVIYRSTVVDAWPDKKWFAPDKGESVTYTARTVSFGTVGAWTFEIGTYDSGGNFVAVRQWNGSGAVNGSFVTWDGRDGSGQPAPAGLYYSRMRAYADGQLWTSAPRPIAIDGRAIVSVMALKVSRNALYVSAQTRGQAQGSMAVQADWGGSGILATKDGTNWEGVVPIVAGVATGVYNLTFSVSLSQDYIPAEEFRKVWPVQVTKTTDGYTVAPAEENLDFVDEWYNVPGAAHGRSDASPGR